MGPRHPAGSIRILGRQMPALPKLVIQEVLSDIDGFLTNNTRAACEKLTAQLRSFSGTLHLTAVGPTAHLARKVCQTLASVNVRSRFLHAVDALHGDIGSVFEGDVVLFVANVDSEELLSLIPALKVKNCRIIALASRHAEAVSALVDSAIHVDEIRSVERSTTYTLKESCTSMFDIYALLVLEIFTVQMMHTRGLTKRQYGENHPSGKIGRHLRLRVSDVLVPLKDIPIVGESEVGLHVLATLAARSKGHGCILVVDSEMFLKGTISDADFRRALLQRGKESMMLTVHELMNFNKQFPRTCYTNELAIAALNTMNLSPVVSYLPALSKEGRVVGLVTTKSLQDAGV